MIVRPSPSPPATSPLPPSPSEQPLSFGVVVDTNVNVVQVTASFALSLESFDEQAQNSYIARLVQVAGNGVSENDITLSISAGSILVVASIRTSSVTAAKAAATAIAEEIPVALSQSGAEGNFLGVPISISAESGSGLSDFLIIVICAVSITCLAAVALLYQCRKLGDRARSENRCSHGDRVEATWRPRATRSGQDAKTRKSAKKNRGQSPASPAIVRIDAAKRSADVAKHVAAQVESPAEKLARSPSYYM